MAPATDISSTFSASATDAAAAHASPAAVDPSKILSAPFRSLSIGDGSPVVRAHGCGCRLLPPSPVAAATGRSDGDKSGFGRSFVDGGVGGGRRPAGLRSCIRPSESIESLDGHLSDDSARSVDSLTSVDPLTLGDAIDHVGDKEAALKASAVSTVPAPAPRVVEPAAAAPLPPFLVAARASLPLRRLNHISFTVASPTATAAFFCDVLGYARIARPRSFDPSGIWLGWGVPVGGGVSGVCPDLQVHLIAGRPLDRPADVQSDRDHLSFEADDVEAVADCLRARGIPFIDEVFEHEGLRQVRGPPRLCLSRGLVMLLL